MQRKKIVPSEWTLEKLKKYFDDCGLNMASFINPLIPYFKTLEDVLVSSLEDLMSTNRFGKQSLMYLTQGLAKYFVFDVEYQLFDSDNHFIVELKKSILAEKEKKEEKPQNEFIKYYLRSRLEKIQEEKQELESEIKEINNLLKKLTGYISPKLGLFFVLQFCLEKL